MWLQTKPSPEKANITFRPINNIDLDTLHMDLSNYDLLMHPKISLLELTAQCSETLSQLLDKHAPTQTKMTQPRPPSPWSSLDYCNSLLNNIAKRDLSKWQRVQNCLARVVLRAPLFSPSIPLLKQLHWLPVNYRINFKLSTLTYRALAIHQPPYLASLLHFSNTPDN